MLILPFGLVLLAFALKRYFGEAWDTRGTVILSWILSILWLVGEIIRQWLHEGILFSIKPETQKLVTPEPPRKVPNLNEPAFGFEIDGVRFSKIRQYAKTLLAMKAAGSVDLREDKWIGHFGSRNKWVNVRTRFENAGAFVRNGDKKNSSFVVREDGGWYVIEQVAIGDESVLN